MASKAPASALVKPESFAIMTLDPASLRELMVENLAGESLGPMDLDRIKMPSGGSSTWEVPTSGGPEPAKVLSAIIVHQQLQRLRWDPNAEGNSPPACISMDAVTGFGDPGGECATCDYAQWGTRINMRTGEKTRGQACKLTRVLFLLFPHQIVPKVLSLPPTSLKAARSYVVGLTSDQAPYWSVVSHIGLSQRKSDAGDVYSFATFERGDSVSSEQLPLLRRYVEMVKPILRQVQADIEPPDDEDDVEVA